MILKNSGNRKGVKSFTSVLKMKCFFTSDMTSCSPIMLVTHSKGPSLDFMGSLFIKDVSCPISTKVRLIQTVWITTKPTLNLGTCIYISKIQCAMTLITNLLHVISMHILHQSNFGLVLTKQWKALSGSGRTTTWGALDPVKSSWTTDFCCWFEFVLYGSYVLPYNG